MPNGIHLDREEKAILDEICKDRFITARQIANRLHLTESRVRYKLGILYSKFGLSELADNEKRYELFKAYCETKEEPFRGATEAVLPTPIPLPPEFNPPGPEFNLPPPEPVIRIPWGGIAIFAIAAFILVLVFSRIRRTPEPPETTPRAEVQQQRSPVPDQTQAQNLIFIDQTRTAIFSRSPTPKPTLRPTATIRPTVTSTPLPLPFIDEFKGSLRPEWTILGVEPNVVKENLVSTGQTFLYIGNEAWTDYTVDITTSGDCILCAGGPTINVGLRVNDDAMIYFECSDNGVVASIRGEDIETALPDASVIGREDVPPNYRFTVKGDTVHVVMNGNHEFGFTLNKTQYERLASGSVMIELLPEVAVGYVKIIP